MIHNPFLTTHFALIFITSMSTSPLIEASNNTIGFTIDLIHRDSPQSPFHNPSLHPSQRIIYALRRSFTQALRFRATESPSSDIFSARGEYLMKYSIGTPPVESLGDADTGSDLTWIQCTPCEQCYKQKLPLFAPDKSSTYKTIPCNSTVCHTFSETSCHPTTETCSYSQSYGDRSFTKGDLSSDAITLGSTRGKTVTIPSITFGCGRRNGGTYSAGESGIVGLGGGKASLVSQLGPLIQGKFSYCLLPYFSNASSKINFGLNGHVLGEGVVSTPIVFKETKTFYYLTLEGISVGNETLKLDAPLSASRAGDEGNIIIDSGTTLTYLPPRLYTKLEDAVKSRIKLETILDPMGIFGLCYFSKTDIVVPEITVHFKGADVKLKSDNTFVRTSNYSVCLAFRAAVYAPPIYGNLAQINFLIGYDLMKKTVSFKPTDCTKF